MAGLPTIAHVLHRLDVAGAEVLAAALARRLRDRFHFAFLCLDGIGPLGEALREEGFIVACLDRRPGVDGRLLGRLRRLVREHRVDLVHAHQYTPFFYAAASRGWRGRPPVLFTEHGRHYPDVRKIRRMLANRLLLRGGDRVTAVGRFVQQALVRNEGLSESRIEVIYNGIDPATFELDDEARAEARQRLRTQWGMGPDTPLILQVARFHPVKDHATAIRAMAQAPAGAHLLLAGDGPQRPMIEQLAAELGLTDRVHFLGVRDDVAQLMAAADVFLLTSLSEGVSVTLLEAMAAGLPIVATDVGGNGEVVADGVTGLLAGRGDAAGLAGCLSRLLGDEALCRRLGQAGRQRLLDRFSQSQMHAAYERVYRAMLSGT